MSMSRTETSYVEHPHDQQNPDLSTVRVDAPPAGAATGPSHPSITQPTDTLGHKTVAVPLHAYLPSTVPADLVPEKSAWVSDSTLSHVIHPASWNEVGRSGPWPFTTCLTYRLPESNALLTWESRKHRRQIEQDVVTSPPAVQARRDALRLSWWRRILRVHLKRWSWHAVLWFNVGSHVLIYAAVSLFIPYLNKDKATYQANTGWSSNVFAAASWLLASVCELTAIFVASPAGKWFQRPKPLLKRHRRQVDQRVYEEAYVQDLSLPYTARRLFDRMDVIIPVLRMVGVLAFLIETIAYSGAFQLTDSHRIDLVFAMGIVAAALWIFTSYLSLAECCHSWLPFRGSLGESLRRLDWWVNVLTLFGSLALLAYFIDLWNQPELLDQRQGPAYAYIVFAVLYTASDWLQAVEQGERFNWEMGPNASGKAPSINSQHNAVGANAV